MPSTKSNSKPRRKFSFEAIGTAWEIELFDGVADAALMKAVKRRIAVFDKAYSRFRDDSLVAEMSRHAGTFTLPADAAPMLDFYRSLYGLTDGAVTPMVGQVLSDAGYDAQYSLKPGRLQRPPLWDEVLSFNPQRPRQLVLHRPVLLDFGAAGKGYLVDLVGGVLAKRGIKTFVVDAGGDMLYRGKTPLEVGLEHPDEPGQVIGVVTLAGGALCGSAGNRRQWGDFHHIIDPHKLESPRHLKAVWVAAKTAMLADGLTTALFFASPDRLQKRYNFEYAMVRDDFSLDASAGFPAEFFTRAAPQTPNAPRGGRGKA